MEDVKWWTSFDRSKMLIDADFDCPNCNAEYSISFEEGFNPEHCPFCGIVYEVDEEYGDEI